LVYFIFLTIGEIESAVGFEHERTYSFFELVMPDGWHYEDFNQFENADDQTEMNKKKSCTHVSKARVEQVNGENLNVSHFCFPFDFQFLATDEGMEKRPFMII